MYYDKIVFKKLFLQSAYVVTHLEGLFIVYNVVNNIVLVAFYVKYVFNANPLLSMFLVFQGKISILPFDHSSSPSINPPLMFYIFPQI